MFHLTALLEYIIDLFSYLATISNDLFRKSLLDMLSIISHCSSNHARSEKCGGARAPSAPPSQLSLETSQCKVASEFHA